VCQRPFFSFKVLPTALFNGDFTMSDAQSLPPDAAAPTAQVTPTTATTTLAQTLQAFEQWRTTKSTPSEPIPDGLWHAIFALEAHFTATKLRTLFGLNQAQYQKKQQELLPMTAATPPTAAPASTPALPFCEARPSPFYEPAPLPVTAPPLIVERID